MATAASLQNIFAPVLLGSWLNAMVYTLELLLAYQYYWNRKHSSPGANTTLVRCVVGLQLFVDTLATLSVFAYAYLFLVAHWGEPAYLTRNPWPGSIHTIDQAITSGIGSFIVHLYLTWRYWNLSKNYLVAVGLGLAALTSTAGAFAAGIVSAMRDAVVERDRIIPICMVWLIASVVADIGIAAALVLQLRSYKSTFARTQSVIHRLIVGAIQTGSVTAVVAVVVLTTFVVWPRTSISLAGWFLLGRLYGCTLLFNLVARRPGSAGGTNQSDDPENLSGSRGAVSFVSHPRERATRMDTFGGIHVHQIVQVAKDNDLRGRGLESKLAEDAEMADDASVATGIGKHGQPMH
ncbi:hypothetical protein MIND_00644900 [Mycena indigotica]|uniref:DUF6534 domain-containing protein n=1 Tax=Mycena indigotica TaxID=2126181 RepID=A0A8H6SRZ2_9AGAR|nr:uncharacterized protein MIND_00644900 [Mycena indigotica]KAF7304133.1 hypothetical protein MIND_00644900 [Mycena indigotica]